MSAHTSSSNVGTYAAGAVVVVLGMKLLAHWVRETVLLPKFTVMKDIKQLGKARPGGKLPGQAIVCGGSISGLIAAAVLSDHYEQVVIVEPEAWVATEEGIQLPNERQIRTNDEGLPHLVNRRSRVYQSVSFHGFLPVLSAMFMRLFPNFTKEIEALGLQENTHLTNYDYYYVSGCQVPPIPEGKERYLTTAFTRDTYERFVRRCLVNSRSNVRHVVGHVTGFTRSSGAPHLRGVTYRTAEGLEKTEDAAIVIDATGPTQVGLKSLERLGVSIPSSLRIQYSAALRMTTMTLVIPPHLEDKLPIPGGWKHKTFIYFFVPDTDIQKEGMIIAKFENSQLGIIGGGWDSDHPPKSIDDFRQCAKNFRCIKPPPQFVFDLFDILEEHIDELQPAVTVVKLPPSNYTRYHQIAGNPDFPPNFVALGDAAMTVNPFFGQGCAKAGVGAATLDQVLRKMDPVRDNTFASQFFKIQATRTEAIWDMNKNIDYGIPSTIPVKGETLAVGAFSRWFAKKVMLMSLKDAELSWSLWTVRWMIAPPTDLMTPGVLFGAFWMWLTGQ